MKYFLLSFILVISSEIYSQNFNNCIAPFGLQIFEAGYGFQSYSAAGINKYVEVYNNNRVNTLTKKMDSFGTSKGYYLTWQFLSIYFDDVNLNFFATLHYSSLSEKQSAQANELTRSYEITVNTIGTGVGFSFPYKNFNLRLIEGILTFNSAKLINTLTGTSSPTEQTLKSDGSELGVIAQVGLDINLPKYYLVLSGSAGYNLFFINSMKFDNGNYLIEHEGSSTKMTNFIDGGGLFINIKAGFLLNFLR